jgi:hypothetical protein
MSQGTGTEGLEQLNGETIRESVENSISGYQNSSLMTYYYPL